MCIAIHSIGLECNSGRLNLSKKWSYTSNNSEIFYWIWNVNHRILDLRIQIIWFRRDLGQGDLLRNTWNRIPTANAVSTIYSKPIRNFSLNISTAAEKQAIDVLRKMIICSSTLALLIRICHPSDGPLRVLISSRRNSYLRKGRPGTW